MNRQVCGAQSERSFSVRRTTWRRASRCSPFWARNFSFIQFPISRSTLVGSPFAVFTAKPCRVMPATSNACRNQRARKVEECWLRDGCMHRARRNSCLFAGCCPPRESWPFHWIRRFKSQVCFAVSLSQHRLSATCTSLTHCSGSAFSRVCLAAWSTRSAALLNCR